MLHLTEIKTIALTEAYKKDKVIYIHSRRESILKSTQVLDGRYCDFDNLKLSLPSFDFLWIILMMSINVFLICIICRVVHASNGGILVILL